MPITVGLYCSHPVNFRYGKKPEYPEKTHDFRESVDILFSHEDWVQVTLWDALLRIGPETSEVKDKWFNATETSLKYFVN